MYSKIYTLCFQSLEAAKIGVSHLSTEIGGAIADANIASLNILLHKEGRVTMIVRFDALEDMNRFSQAQISVLAGLENVFKLREMTQNTAISVYLFDREAATVV
ncbi:MAG: hypothetical protein N4A39_14120 [Roseicyclus sp.]|jgi:hypothetical protein|uniref:hypothetical protein n=1 Tax=Roseicyclus amphidinii TaxID=3034232 RepID=UPI0024E11271|nr:hypothetical protein [Roseicyclus sp. Amp-Y-6]MCT4684856.1 hypothetical protein [Roseicyclus sp.]